MRKRTMGKKKRRRCKRPNKGREKGRLGTRGEGEREKKTSLSESRERLSGKGGKRNKDKKWEEEKTWKKDELENKDGEERVERKDWNENEC